MLVHLQFWWEHVSIAREPRVGLAGRSVAIAISTRLLASVRLRPHEFRVKVVTREDASPGSQDPGDPGETPRLTPIERSVLEPLRRKLEDNPARPRHLLTERGMGYRYLPSASAYLASDAPGA